MPNGRALHCNESLSGTGFSCTLPLMNGKYKMTIRYPLMEFGILLVPTAVNQQRFLFTLEDGKVSAQPGHAFYVKMDLGIAKYHFETSAGKENFQRK